MFGWAIVDLAWQETQGRLQWVTVAAAKRSAITAPVPPPPTAIKSAVKPASETAVRK